MSELLPKNTDKNGRDSKGRFADGNNGRPKGTPNKNTRVLKDFITGFLNEKTYEIPHIWDSLDDKEKATLFLHLSRLVLPKQNAEQSEENKNITVFNIDPFITKEEGLIKVKELDEEY